MAVFYVATYMDTQKGKDAERSLRRLTSCKRRGTGVVPSRRLACQKLQVLVVFVAAGWLVASCVEARKEKRRRRIMARESWASGKID